MAQAHNTGKGHSTKEYNHAWYLENRAKKLAYDKKWQRVNRQRLLDTKKRYRDSHPIEAQLWSQARRTKTRGIKINKQDIYNWESRLCGICQKIIEDKFHIDHIIPLFRGGLHVVSNLQLTHPKCNLRKQFKLQEELNF